MRKALLTLIDQFWETLTSIIDELLLLLFFFLMLAPSKVHLLVYWFFPLYIGVHYDNICFSIFSWNWWIIWFWCNKTNWKSVIRWKNKFVISCLLSNKSLKLIVTPPPKKKKLWMFQTKYNMKRCVGSIGKAVDPGMIVPGFKPWTKQHNIKIYIFLARRPFISFTMTMKMTYYMYFLFAMHLSCCGSLRKKRSLCVAKASFQVVDIIACSCWPSCHYFVK